MDGLPLLPVDFKVPEKWTELCRDWLTGTVMPAGDREAKHTRLRSPLNDSYPPSR